jgi:hypothetical protein
MPKTEVLKFDPPARPPVEPENPFLEFRGLLPRAVADFLGGLNGWELQHVSVLLGFYEEVRVLIGTAWILHQYLREGPHSAARGRLTFQEFMDSKEKILHDIRALRSKVARLAESVSLRLPHIQARKENVRVHQYLRVS